MHALRYPVSKACIVFIQRSLTATSVIDNLDKECSPQLEMEPGLLIASSHIKSW